MKKFILSAAILLGCTLLVHAQETANNGSQAPAQQTQTSHEGDGKWDFFQLGFWFGIPPETNNTNVYGMKLGIPSCGGIAEVDGLETSVCASGTDYVNGVQSSLLVNISKQVTGLQGGVINYCDKVIGLQLGVLNFAENSSFQIGILNYIKDSPLPYFPICNVYFK